MAALEETHDTGLPYASDGCADPELAGYYGPGSVTWRLGGDLSSPVAGLRSPGCGCGLSRRLVLNVGYALQEFAG